MSLVLDLDWCTFENSLQISQVVDHNKTVGSQAFGRIASACPAIADPITVHNLFDALSSSTNGKLHFIVYDKYIGSLDKYIGFLYFFPSHYDHFSFCKVKI